MKKIFSLIAVVVLSSIQIHAQTWTSHNVGIVDIMDVSFPRVDSGYALDGNSILHKTFDGATTWTTITSPPNVVSMFFVSGKTGCIGADSDIYRTTDAGVTWTPVLHDGQVVFDLNSIYFVDALNGFAGGFKLANDSMRLYKTSNGGVSWSLVSRMETQFPDEAFYFFNSTTGLWANNNNVSLTTNGGTSFSSVYQNFSDLMENISFSDIDTGYAVGYFGVCIKSVNGGTSWSQITYPGSSSYDLHFIDGRKGFACGGNGFNAGYVFQTSDGGSSWIPVYTSTNTFGCMDFPADTIGYVGGQNGIVLKFSGIATSIAENQGPHSLSIYPNPATESVTISNAIPGTRISLLNLSGQIIKEETVESSTLKMNLENVASGIYFIQMENAGEKNVQKLVIER